MGLTTVIGVGVKQCEAVRARRGLSSGVVTLSGALDRVGVGVMAVWMIQNGREREKTEKMQSYDVGGRGGEVIDLRCGVRRPNLESRMVR